MGLFGNSVSAQTLRLKRIPQERRRRKALGCLLAMALVAGIAFPSLVFPPKAEADSNANPACNLTWEELKPHLEEGLGVPYLFGGASKSGWDCSGYVSWAFNTFGGQNYTHYTTSFENELKAKGCFVMEGADDDLRDGRMEAGDIIFFYSAGIAEPTHMGVVGERVDGIVMVYHAFTNSFSDIYGNSGTMLQGLDANPGSSLPGIWHMSSGHGKGSWSRFAVYRGVNNTGSVALRKSSANNGISANNANYSLEGAIYGLYSSESHAQGNTDPIVTLATDIEGKAQADDIKCGTYYLKEISPSKGYAIDENIYPVEVPSGEVATVSIGEQPQYNPMEIWLSKYDSETGRSESQGDGSLACAQFEITFYGGQFSSRSEADAAARNGIEKRTWIMQTNEQGRIEFSNADSTFDIHDNSGVASATLPYFISGDKLFTQNERLCLPLGTLFVRETIAPSGYALDNAPDLIVNIASEEISPIVLRYEAPAISEQVLRGGISIGKIDRETSEHNPLGAATLEGAVFSVTNRSAHSVVVDGNEYRPGQTILTIETDEAGIASTASNALPFGTYEIKEIEAPEGYLIDANSRAWSKTVSIREAKVYDLASTSESVSDQVKRGDIAFSKADGKTMERMASVPFAITSLTSGEKHVVVTDENGTVDTSSEWNAHSKNTNANDGILASEEADLNSEAGLWFSGRENIATKADDALGALPFDSYRIEELRCKTNEGKELLSFDITVKRNKTKLDLGTVDNSPLPTVRTTLTNANGDHVAAANDSVCLIDTIDYEGLTPGKAYAAQGELHFVEIDADGNRKDGGPVTTASGETVIATTEFSPKTANGKTEVEFSLDSSSLTGKQVVAFERITLDNELIAEHSDPSDTDQTVTFPGISTKLKSEKALTAPDLADACTLIDTVEYHALLPGKTYTLNAELHVRSTDGSDEGAAKDEKGSPITAKQTFTPSESSGEVEVTFIFNAPSLAGKTVVAFEKLERNDIVLATHADISDDSQSVAFPKIETKATVNESGAKILPALGSASITDNVAYVNLEPNTEYRLVATAHIASTDADGKISDGGAVTNEEGEPITTEVFFTPNETSGEAEVPLTVCGKELGGLNIVIFERCYKGAELIAAHENISDENQTLLVPLISTNARSEKTGSRVDNSEGETAIIDQVHYENLMPDVEYRIEGTLHLASIEDNGTADDEGTLTKADGKDIVATASFRSKESSGDIELRFPLDTENLDDKAVVAFETLTQEGTTLAEHADINDKNQTVLFPAKPTSPEKENAVEKIKKAFAKTGDSIIPFAATALIAGVAGVAAVMAMRSRNKNRRP